MNFIRSNKWLAAAALLIAAAVWIVGFSAHQKIDFNTQVKPIFNKKCIACHGGVRQKGDFSLLFRTEALAPTKSGKPAIVPGHADQSELIKRICSNDLEERMPFKADALTKDEIKILKDWIDQGAEWGDHWAYVSVKETPLPNINEKGWPKNGIDYFVQQKLAENKLPHSPEANKTTLLRRASLDLIGLPAPETIGARFLGDSTGKSYETFIDSLLTNKHFGEKWASMWLDLARYADTKGYEHDGDRAIWRYRDWLIKAFNDDKPYDQFLTEQLAGDLMPNATDDQLIATAFHRNSMTNDEGGTDPEEFRVAAVIDRVNTTWEALMGTTFACVQCHAHPYDPFKRDDYYKFMAFFNNSRDENTEFDYPLLRHFSDTAAQQLTLLNHWLANNADKGSTDEINLFLKTWQPVINSVVFDKFEHSALADGRRVMFRDKAVCRAQQVDLTGKDHLIYRYDAFVKNGVLTVHLDSADGQVLFHKKLEAGKPGLKFSELDFTPIAGVHDLYFTYKSNSYSKEIDEDCALFEWFYFTKKFPGAGKPGYAEMKKRYWGLMSLKPPTTPIMLDNPVNMSRTTHVFERGNWLVKGDIVGPDVPGSLNPFPNAAPRNRLGMAMWLVSKENPLTARTIVNRVWEQLFGMGLAETLEDMGTQGIPPVHKDLLDYLSHRLMNEHQWSLKKLTKEIMMSATYRQQSNLNDLLTEKDPSNKFYARGPRVRLSAEQIRDQTMAVSGLLSEKMFGAPVMPWQPKGIWSSPWNGASWYTSKGEDQYRRAIYTFWKRTAAYPSMLSFDGVAREVCTVRRIRTNTPLQALVSLNDSVYVEAANYFALKLIKDNPKIGFNELIQKAFSSAMQHDADQKSLMALNSLFETAVLNFNKHKAEQDKLLANTDLKNPETAALMVVVNAIFNLDEFVTKT